MFFQCQPSRLNLGEQGEEQEGQNQQKFILCWGLGSQPCRVQGGLQFPSQDSAKRLSGEQGQSLAGEMAKGTPLSHENILCTAREQAGSCLQGCSSECMAAAGLRWCL